MQNDENLLLDKYPIIWYTNSTKREENFIMGEINFYVLCIIGIIVGAIIKSRNAPDYIEWIREENEKW